MQQDVLFDRIKDVVSKILRESGIELIDIAYKKEGSAMVLRILADKEGGITLEECARMNQAIGEALDTEDIISEKYTLDVSSPGLDRPLKSREDFLRLKGKGILVHTYELIEGRRECAGILETVENDTIAICGEDSKRTRISLNKISKATFDYKNLLKKGQGE